LQTLDQGAPVSVYTVAKELGHGGEAMVRRVYGHLGTVHHRSEVVEYRVEQHAERLRQRLEASGLGTRYPVPGPIIAAIILSGTANPTNSGLINSAVKAAKELMDANGKL
jgi:hypothetical protein